MNRPHRGPSPPRRRMQGSLCARRRSRSELFCRYLTADKYVTRRSNVTYVAARRVGPVTRVTISLRGMDPPLQHYRILGVITLRRYYLLCSSSKDDTVG